MPNGQTYEYARLAYALGQDRVASEYLNPSEFRKDDYGIIKHYGDRLGLN